MYEILSNRKEHLVLHHKSEDLGCRKKQDFLSNGKEWALPQSNSQTGSSAFAKYSFGLLSSSVTTPTFSYLSLQNLFRSHKNIRRLLRGGMFSKSRTRQESIL